MGFKAQQAKDASEGVDAEADEYRGEDDSEKGPEIPAFHVGVDRDRGYVALE